jgi:predicted nucleotidyltransferase
MGSDPAVLTVVKQACIQLAHTLFSGEAKLRIVLFGSRANGTANPRSDIDVGVDAGHPLSLADLSLAREALESLRIMETVDLVDLAAVDKSFRREVDRFETVVIYER